jgi:hypothetical protein
MSNFLQFASLLTGSDYKRVKISTPASRTKVIALGLGVLVPTAIWVTSTFLFAFLVLNASFLASFVISGIIGFLILTIERLIVMGNGNWFVTIFRILLAFFVAYLGAQLFDLVIFSSDIDQMIPQIKHEEGIHAQRLVKEQWEERYNLTAKQNNAQAKWNQFIYWQEEANKEASGLSSNKLRGAGSATKFKQEVANRAKIDFSTVNSDLESLKLKSAENEKQAYDSVQSNMNPQSILIRVKAMNRMISNNTEMRNLYFAISIILFFIEFLVLIFKLTWPETAYENEVKAIESISIQRNKSLQNHQVDNVLKTTSNNLRLRMNTLI